MEASFAKTTFWGRLRSMLAVDVRRMFTTPFFYILLSIAVAMPILILVMTTLMEGKVSVDPQTGAETVMEGFDHVFQIIGSVSTDKTGTTTGAEAGGSTAAAAGGMDLVSMCNIDLLYFGLAVLVCVFVADDFRSGYAKNLFAVRASKGDYVISKILVCTLGGALLILGFFGGALIGGGVAGLPFTMDGFGTGNLTCCIVAKMLLVGIFAGIYSLMAVIAKQRLWLSLLLSLCTGMFLFNMVPMITPLDAGMGHVLLSLVGAFLLATGFGTVSRLLLQKTDIL